MHHVSHNICSSQKLWFLSTSSPPCLKPPIFLSLEIKRSLLFWTFQEGFYNQGKLVLNDDKLYFCIKNFTAYFSKKLKDFSISNALTPTILLILHERWLKLIQTFPVCGDYDSFFPYNSSKIWLQISWWLLVPECLNSWN